MSKYAPAREDGLYPYVREQRQFTNRWRTIVYARSLTEAKRMHGWTRMRFTTITIRRATPEDMHLPETQ